MEVSELIGKVQELTDIELAMLLSLIAGQHCIIQTERDALNSLEQEIQLVRLEYICDWSVRLLSYRPDRYEYIWTFTLDDSVQRIHHSG